jgi:predicted histidine transporter YuiF (NhaC family)
MFFNIANRLSRMKSVPKKSYLFIMFVIGAILYVGLHHYLFSGNNKFELINKYKSYIYFIMIVDFLIAIYIASTKQYENINNEENNEEDNEEDNEEYEENINEDDRNTKKLKYSKDDQKKMDSSLQQLMELQNNQKKHVEDVKSTEEESDTEIEVFKKNK